MFSTTFRYSLISLLELAEAEDLLQAGTIATRHQLSHHYLSVVLGELRRLGLVQSHKGKKGGYRLICPPSEVTLLFLFRALAGSPDSEAWQSTGHQQSGVEAVTPLRSAADSWLLEISQRWSAELEATSLADLQRGGPASRSGSSSPTQFSSG